MKVKRITIGLVGMLLAGLVLAQPPEDQPAEAPAAEPVRESLPVQFPSATPQFTFTEESLEAQRAELATNPLMLRFAESRQAQAADPYRPAYHFVSPESQLNDPNGLCYWNGKWHMFYQAYPADEFPAPENIRDRRQHWGHAVSDDMVHWEDLPYAIYPGIERMCFSGGTVVDDDKVVAFYPGIHAGQMVAVADDPLLLNWDKVPGNPVMQNVMGDACIWKQGDTYYGLMSSRTVAKSTDLSNWEIARGGEFVIGVGYEDGACPTLRPLGDKYLLTVFSHHRGGQYLLGDFDPETLQFAAYEHGWFNHGRVSPGGVHAPSTASDPEIAGAVVNIMNINDGRHDDNWDQIMSLPQLLTLTDDKHLRIEPYPTLASLRGEHFHMDETVLPANEEIIVEGFASNTFELSAEIDPAEARWVRLNVLRSREAEEETSITFYNFDRPISIWYHTPGEMVLDATRSSTLDDVWIRPPERAEFARNGENLRLRVFVDKSVVEVFINERLYMALRVYPGREDSLGISLQAQGQEAVLKSLDCWELEPIWPQE